MKTKVITAVTLAILLASMFAIVNPVKAEVATMEVRPTTVNYNPSLVTPGVTKFNVTLVLLGYAAHVGGIQFRVAFNQTVINYTRFWEARGPQWIFDGFTVKTLPTAPDSPFTYDGPTSAHLLMTSLLDPVTQNPGGDGNGTVFIVEFVIKQNPAKGGYLFSALDIDSVDTYFIDYDSSDYLGDGPGEVTKNSGHFSNIWSPPANPYMGITPLTTTYGPLPPPVGPPANPIPQPHLESIYIKGLSTAWDLTAATFTLTYNATVKSIVTPLTDIVLAPGWAYLAGPTVTENPDPTILDTVSMSVSWVGPPASPGGTPLGNQKIVDITFHIMLQWIAQPIGTVPAGWFDISFETFSGVLFEDHIMEIPQGIHEQGWVKVYAEVPMTFPWLVIDPALTTKGPAYSVGSTFMISVKITGDYRMPGLDAGWKLIGLQYRVFYDPSFLEPINVIEGGFLQNPAWDKYGTAFFPSIEPDGLGPHVLIGEILNPNGTGDYDQTAWPNGTGTVAQIQFKLLKQGGTPSYLPYVTLTSDLDLGDVFGEYGLNANGDYIPFNTTMITGGTVKVYPYLGPWGGLPGEGRNIDLVGGANNAGYGPGYPGPFPDPYGGQGWYQPMDLVFPQSEITLYATVTYNGWPVQQKDVGFEIEGPFVKDPEGEVITPLGNFSLGDTYMIWAKLTARTDANGVATLTFRMPWPCDFDVQGLWRVTATVNVADQVVYDALMFYYEYPVIVSKVTTDKMEYVHGETVLVTVEWKTHSMQAYPFLLSIVITDELGVPFGMVLYGAAGDVTFGGATWCTWKSETLTFGVPIPKFAFAGLATVHVNVYDKDPTDGGFAYSPEYAPAPQFYVLPL
jgi:hypothetical protein